MIHWLPSDQIVFPHPSNATPEGILALGGDLSPTRLITAYLYGIFPWYSQGEPIIWWYLSPRMVLIPGQVKISKSMRSILNRGTFSITFNRAFHQVINQCASVPRAGQNGTWIDSAIIRAYSRLHQLGCAVSVEVWEAERLVGGLYGLCIGKIFYGESMFSLRSNASKAALISLCQKLDQNGFTLIDCQQDTPHMRTMGAGLIDSPNFQKYLFKNRLFYLNTDSPFWNYT